MKQYFFLLLLFLSFLLKGQNLVKNPSFETTKPNFVGKSCAYSQVSEFNTAFLDWQCSNIVTADVLSFDKQKNYCFPTAPRTGQRMAGIITYHPHQDSGYDFDYHEHLQGTLTQALEIGKTYTFEFWVYSDDSLAAKHLRTVLGSQAQGIMSVFANNMSVQFSTKKLDIQRSWINALQQNPKQYTYDKIINPSKNWQKVQYLIKADSAYQYFYIGNFQADSLTKTNLKPALSHRIDSLNTIPPKVLGKQKTFWERRKRIAYYCIDDVNMQEGNHIDTNNKTIDFSEIVSKNATYIFQNIRFELNKAQLLENSTQELDLLATHLQNQPQLKIRIEGHCDKTGTATQNQKLSMQRADAVKNYLLQKRIAPQRMTSVGLGDTHPLVQEDNEEARAKNRRVQVVFVEN